MLPDSRESLTKERKNVKKSEEKQKRQCIDSSYSEPGLSNQLGTRWRFNRGPSSQFKAILSSSIIQFVLELNQNNVA